MSRVRIGNTIDQKLGEIGSEAMSASGAAHLMSVRAQAGIDVLIGLMPRNKFLASSAE